MQESLDNIDEVAIAAGWQDEWWVTANTPPVPSPVKAPAPGSKSVLALLNSPAAEAAERSLAAHKNIRNLRSMTALVITPKGLALRGHLNRKTVLEDHNKMRALATLSLFLSLLRPVDALSVRGNVFVEDGKVIKLRGVSHSGTEYGCVQKNPDG